MISQINAYEPLLSQFSGGFFVGVTWAGPFFRPKAPVLPASIAASASTPYASDERRLA
jgi:hypothetical protein